MIMKLSLKSILYVEIGPSKNKIRQEKVEQMLKLRYPQIRLR